MFEIGFLELVVVGVVALLVLGPERLPYAARMTGALIGRITRAVQNLREEIEREVNIYEMQQRLKKQLDDGSIAQIKKDLANTEHSIRQSLEAKPIPKPDEPAAVPSATMQPSAMPSPPVPADIHPADKKDPL